MFWTLSQKNNYIVEYLQRMENLIKVFKSFKTLTFFENATLQTFFLSILNSLIILISILIMVALYTWTERKLLSTAQRRSGPNVQGFWGILQAFADGLKLLLKEIIIPVKANQIIYLFSAIWSFTIALVGWAVIPFSPNFVLFHTEYSILYTLCLSSLGVYGIIFAGWASNSKYAFLGALRSAAQMISYEVSMSLVLIPIIMLANSFNYGKIIVNQEDYWFGFLLAPLAVIFFISVLAETNRAPFDLPEAEAELVAGYHIEHSGFTFALFFLAEYSNMLLYSVITSILFLGGWFAPFNFTAPSSLWLIVKTLIIAFLFVFVRANLPRYRYDQLMRLGWKTFLPFCLGYLIFIAAMLNEFRLHKIVQDMEILTTLFSDRSRLHRLPSHKRFFLFLLILFHGFRVWRSRIIPVFQRRWQAPGYSFYTETELRRSYKRQMSIYRTACSKLRCYFPPGLPDKIFRRSRYLSYVNKVIPKAQLDLYVQQLRQWRRPRKGWNVVYYMRGYLSGKRDYWL